MPGSWWPQCGECWKHKTPTCFWIDTAGLHWVLGWGFTSRCAEQTHLLAALFHHGRVLVSPAYLGIVYCSDLIHPPESCEWGGGNRVELWAGSSAATYMMPAQGRKKIKHIHSLSSLPFRCLAISKNQKEPGQLARGWVPDSVSLWLRLTLQCC